MIETEPKVYLIAEPTVNTDAMFTYLQEVGGREWYDRVVVPVWAENKYVGATELVEFCGRLCYKSWKPGLNKNVTKIREDSAEYLLNVLTSGHGSVIEHAHFTFVLHDISRVLTAELNRHRHPNISEQSLRYVRLDQDIRFRIPDLLPDEVQAAGRTLIEEIENFMSWAYEYCGLDNEGDEAGAGISFAEKKTITSALRRFAPLGLSTEEVWTANLRDIRHVIEMRTAAHAEEEIRIVANQIAEIMAKRAPFFFQDYEKKYTEPDVVNGAIPVWETAHEKV
jgi:thymidylate synthase (FAD)